jgi:2,3-dihydroxy-p-cumate/2,3-dihydroxybenzoate 3,4-dioxygenase
MDVVGLRWLGQQADGAQVLGAGTVGGLIVLREGAEAGCSLAAWEVDDGRQLDALAGRLEAARVPFTRQPPTGDGPCAAAGSVGFLEPATGASHMFYVPLSTDSPHDFTATHTRIQRLGHVVFATPHAAVAVEHAQRWMDFLVSDWIVGGTTFLRPARSPYHHALGIGHAEACHFHHLNFMVSAIDDIGRALHRFARYGTPVVFGPGRHPVSGSVFLYFLDPDGLTLEYSFGTETFAGTDHRAARCWPRAPESIDAWGSPRDPRMGSTGRLGATKHEIRTDAGPYPDYDRTA